MPSLGETVATLASRRTAASGLRPSSRRLDPTREFGLNRGALVMLSYVPKALAPGAGLVVVLHGCTQTAQAYAEGAGWLELADRYGFVVLCPEQQRTNNPNLCFNWFAPEDMQRGRGEAASIHEMIQTAVEAYDLDRRRIFITGLSAGGAMANVMLATYPEVFAAGAIFAGLPYASATNVAEAFSAMSGKMSRSDRELGEKVRSAAAHNGPWPQISVWQGDQDHTVRASVAEAVAAQWVEVHGGTPEVTAPATGRRAVQHWRGPDGGVVVELHRISGMGHGAPLSCSGPDACGAAGPFLLDVGISSSIEVARSWGLATAATTATPRTAPTPPPRQPQPRSNGGAFDVGAVISNALRSAGLMK